jgi:hypothetical protein
MIICRSCITLRNGRILWASQVGKKAFCFEASPDYLERKKQQKEFKQKELENSNS